MVGIAAGDEFTHLSRFLFLLFRSNLYVILDAPIVDIASIRPLLGVRSCVGVVVCTSGIGSKSRWRIGGAGDARGQVGVVVLPILVVLIVLIIVAGRSLDRCQIYEYRIVRTQLRVFVGQPQHS